MIFDGILGNENIKKLLRNALLTGNISHSYMFIGKQSIGKKLFAKEFAKGILCSSSKEKPCNNCTSCIKIENENHPDFFILDEVENTIKNEQIHEINKKILEKPIESLKKVYIINNSENMTVSAQNSLLKTLEEPPEHAIIILITSNENKMLNTIKSRCTKIVFNKLNDEEVKNILKEKYKIEASKKTLQIANGCVSRAIKIHENEEVYNRVEEAFTNIKSIDIIEFSNQKNCIFEQKEEAQEILEYINIIFYELSKTNTSYLNCINIVEQTKERLLKNCNYDMTIDNLLFKVWEEING